MAIGTAGYTAMLWVMDKGQEHVEKRSKFNDEQIALKQAELGISVEEVCRKMDVSDATGSCRSINNLRPSMVNLAFL
jgi:hypothetical protein